MVANEPTAETTTSDNENTNTSNGTNNSSRSNSSTTTTGTSPKTADSSAVIYIAEALAVVSLAGVVICRKKSRA